MSGGVCLQHRIREVIGFVVAFLFLLSVAPGAGLPAPAPVEVAESTGGARTYVYSEYCGGVSQGADESCSVTFSENPAATVYVIYCRSTCSESLRTSGILTNIAHDPVQKGYARFIRTYEAGESEICTEYAYRAPNSFSQMEGSLAAGEFEGCIVPVHGKWGVAVDHAGAEVA